MATLANTYPTLADLYSQQEGMGDIATIIEMLAQRAPVIRDGIVVECNDGSSHLTTVRTGLPTPTWRRLYEGVLPTKGGTAQVSDVTGMLEDWSEVDAKLVDIAKNPQKFRLNEARAHVYGIAHELESTIFYGDIETDPEKFMGLHPRFNDLSAANGNQIIDAAGTGSDNTSIWFITWGEDSVHLLYPEGTQAGLKRSDKGLQTKEDSTGKLYDVYREKFTQDIGLSVRDWRGVARIANIDVSDLTKDAASGADLLDLMTDAYYQLDNPNQPNGRTVCYTNKTIAKFLDKQTTNNGNVHLQYGEVQGRKVPHFRGVPIEWSDSILETEAQIT